jgi:hypothetical protein
MGKKAPVFEDFDRFWPYYLAQHRRPRTRALHLAGLGTGFALAVTALATGDWPWLVAAPAAAYGLSWLGHGAVERNRPATFDHPLWSIRGDFRMAKLMLTGKLRDELARHGLE